MRELKLIHAADLHLDAPFGSLSPEAAAQRRADRRRLLFALAELTREREVDALLLCGDIFDGTDIERETALDFCKAVGGLNIPVLAVTGNHDPGGAEGPWAGLELPENFYLFDKNEFDFRDFPELSVRFWGSGFEQRFCPPVLRSFAAPERQEGVWDVMLLHGDMVSGNSDYNPVSREDIAKSGMDYIALGHIHNRTALQLSGNTAYAYPGCTEGGGYDECGEMGALVVTLDDRGVQAEFVPLGGVRYEIVNIDISEREPLEAVQEAVSNLSDKDCVRIIFIGEIDSPLDLSALNRALAGRLAEVQLRDETRPRRDVWEHRGQDNLEGVFLAKLWDMRERTENDEERRKIELAARYGLAALEKGGARL